MSTENMISVGDASKLQAGVDHVVVHICGVGGWPHGPFSERISERWPDPEVRFLNWQAQGDDFEVGQYLLVSNGPGEPKVANVLMADNEGQITDTGFSALDKLAEDAVRFGATVHIQLEQLVTGELPVVVARILSIFSKHNCPVRLYQEPGLPAPRLGNG